MTAPASTAQPTGSPRRTRLLVGAAVLTLLAVLVLSQPRQDPWDHPPLDPRATNPNGLAGLVALLRESGATVRIGGLPTGEDDVVLQVQDTFSGEAADHLAAWVADGGRLVTTDPHSQLGYAQGLRVEYPLWPRMVDCEVPALDDLELAETPTEAFDVYLTGEMRDGLYRPGDIVRCFSHNWESWLVAWRHGSGSVVALAGATPFLNGHLDRADNAAIATTVLLPHRDARVRILDPSTYLSDLSGADTEEGDGTILGALPVGGRQAIGQLVVAFGLWALARGRRLGRPVPEELPVPIPASDLVLATGELLAGRGDVAGAAERIRRPFRREAGVLLGLGPDPDPVALADALATRAGLAPDRIAAALLHHPLDDTDLVRLARQIDHLRKDLHGHDH